MLIGQAGLKRRSRLAMAACILGANAPDIDVFEQPLFGLPSIGFHRGPAHSLFAWPVLATGIVGLLWLYHRLRPGDGAALPFRAGALWWVSLAAVVTHPFLDWLTTYAIALLAPWSWRWTSGDAVFIVDWVFWLLMISGISASRRRERLGIAFPGRPAQLAGVVMLAYIAANLVESALVERQATAALRRRGIAAALVVSSPPPLAFWDRTIAWRSANAWGSGSFAPGSGLQLDPGQQPLRLDDRQLAAMVRASAQVRAFLSWSRMPIVVTLDGRTFLSDQRYYGVIPQQDVPQSLRTMARRHAFLVPLDGPQER